jgi:hypothetical protein
MEPNGPLEDHRSAVGHNQPSYGPEPLMQGKSQIEVSYWKLPCISAGGGLEDHLGVSDHVGMGESSLGT